jgi:three-Cys-motif partner protein
MKYDEIGYWSELKLDIIREYATAYSTIISAQKYSRLYHIYIDAFAGAGQHISKITGDWIPGSPLNALQIKPPFREYHLIDLDSKKVDSLRDVAGSYSNVQIYEGDCNKILLDEILPKAKWEDYRRALCLLDPYGLHLQWPVIELAGTMKSVEIFLNFPIYDMNLNVLRRNTDKVYPQQAARLTSYWGDESWRQAAYDTTGNLFGWEEKQGNDAVVSAFRERLKKVAGFKYVPEPIPMRNRNNAVVYYLFFASHKPVAAHIVAQIFEKYRNIGGV